MPTSFTFVHAADLHLDTPFRGLGSQAAHVQQALIEASLQAFDALIDLTLEVNAAFLLLAGDLYDGPDRDVRAQLRFLRGLERLGQAGVQVFIVHGNHDPVEGGWSAIRRWPHHVHVFGADGVSYREVVRDGGPLALIHGISYRTRHVHDNLASAFRRAEAPLFQVGLLHANVGDPDHAPYAPCTLDDLAAANLDYWALGHVHRRQAWRHGRGWIAYPGNLQGRSPKPSEAGAKGALVVEVVDGAAAEPRFVALDRVRFVSLAVETDDLADLGQLQALLVARALDQQTREADRALVLRAELLGRTPSKAQLSHSGAVEGLRQALNEQMGARPAFIWWDAIEDRTRHCIDPGALRERDDLVGALLEVSDDVLQDDATASRWLGGSPPPRVGEGFELSTLVAEARDLVLDLLLQEEG